MGRSSRIALAVYLGHLRSVAIYLPALFMADTLTLLVAQLIFLEMRGDSVFEQLSLLFNEYYGAKILCVFTIIKLMQGLFVVAMATVLGAMGGRPAMQAMRGLVFFAVFYSLLTILARSTAESYFSTGYWPENQEYLYYAYIAAGFYVIPYTIGTIGLLAYLSTGIRNLMSYVDGAPPPRVPNRLAELGATRIRLPFARAAKR